MVSSEKPGRVRIVTDSACDLSADQAEELGVVIVPLTIRFGDDEFTDGVELSPADFYARMAREDRLPETAAPAPGAFDAAFRRLADEGATAVVCLNLSSQLSATMSSAQNAAQGLEGEIDVRVLDSRSITAGLGLQVVEAARAAEAGRSAAEVVELIEELRERVHVYGALDTLDNLRKGGRIGGAQAMLGSILSIKPVIDISTGAVEEAAKPRTRRKAIEWLRDKTLSFGAVEHVHVMSGLAPDTDVLVDLLCPPLRRDDVSVVTIGPVIGSHGGPRVIGTCFAAPR